MARTRDEGGENHVLDLVVPGRMASGQLLRPGRACRRLGHRGDPRPVLVGALVALSLVIVAGLLAFEGVELRVAERRARRFLGF
jgi:hypothetical protein